MMRVTWSTPRKASDRRPPRSSRTACANDANTSWRIPRRKPKGFDQLIVLIVLESTVGFRHQALQFAHHPAIQFVVTEGRRRPASSRRHRHTSQKSCSSSKTQKFASASPSRLARVARGFRWEIKILRRLLFRVDVTHHSLKRLRRLIKGDRVALDLCIPPRVHREPGVPQSALNGARRQSSPHGSIE